MHRRPAFDVQNPRSRDRFTPSDMNLTYLKPERIFACSRKSEFCVTVYPDSETSAGTAIFGHVKGDMLGIGTIPHKVKIPGSQIERIFSTHGSLTGCPMSG